MSTGRETGSLTVEMRRCLPERDRVSIRGRQLFTGGRQDVYRKETEGVYERETGCLPKVERGLPEGDMKSTSRRQRVSTGGRKRVFKRGRQMVSTGVRHVI